MDLFSSWTGPDFLAFYGLMLLTCVLAGFWIPANLRPLGRPAEPADMEETALLSGGPERHTDAIIADLFARGGLAQSSKTKLAVQRHDVANGNAAKALLTKQDAFSLDDARKALAIDAERVEARLIRRGLIMPKSEQMRLRLLSVAPYAALLLVGLYRQQAGAKIGEPTGYLIALMVLTGMIALVRYGRFNPRTVAGDQAVYDLKLRSTRLRTAPTASEVGFAVGLFGTAVLVGTPWQPVHAMRQSSSGDSGGGNGDGDGGGGGGCGGCGG